MLLGIDTAIVRESCADALALAFPVSCAGCAEPGRALCAACRTLLRAPSPRRRDVDGLVVWSALRYEDTAARVIRSVKEDGRTGLARPLGGLLGPVVALAGWPDALLVPVPSSRAALRRRGYSVPEMLCRRSGRPWARVLRLTRTAADQRALGRDDRARNVAGAMLAVPAVAGATVVVVDDVVTTGATLREAERALVTAGARVCGAVTLADTPRRISPVVHP